jgi:3-carboxy-cis,cis-muconate cycloisomerase
VGTLASLGEKGLAVQQGMLEELGLLQPPTAWHTVRDTIAEAGCFMGILCGLLDKVATDVKVMMKRITKIMSTVADQFAEIPYGTETGSA